MAEAPPQHAMAAEAPPSISTHVAVLGDSLSVAGYGIGRVEDTWPHLLQSELGHGVRVSVHAQGQLHAEHAELSWRAKLKLTMAIRGRGQRRRTVRPTRISSCWGRMISNPQNARLMAWFKGTHESFCSCGAA